MTHKELQVGGGVDAAYYLYIERGEYDEQLLNLLLKGEYANVLTSRQMGKTSLLNRTRELLRERGVRTAEVDLASELEGAQGGKAYFRALMASLAERLEIQLDLNEFERRYANDAPGQWLQRFFREIVASAIKEPVVIFLDEIDSTLKFPFTDGLFTAIRGMYNERALRPVYRQFTFCLLGVASPNELIKDHRTTPYNIGETLNLRDFDADLDDLSSLAEQLSADSQIGWDLLRRVLYWSGGQPFLTMKICREVQRNKIVEPSGVDILVHQAFRSLTLLRYDNHFQPIFNLVLDQQRFGSPADSLVLYRRILLGKRIQDRTDPAYIHLKLSGLVKRDAEGFLIVRNPIYTSLFNVDWVASTEPMQALGKIEGRYRRVKFALVVVSGLMVVLVSWGFNEWRLSQPIHTEGDDYWAKIEAGTFCMGSRDRNHKMDTSHDRCEDQPIDSESSEYETPVHWVVIEKPFLLARYETTVEEYERFTHDTGRRPPADYGFGAGLSAEQRKKISMVGVSWEDAREYAAWVTRKTGRNYRLPTEAEWEYAARAGTRQPRYWQENTSNGSICLYANFADRKAKQKYNLSFAYDCDDGFADTAPVGTYPSNAWGLFDMLGNVWEWTEDCWHKNYNKDPENPTAWLRVDCSRRVIRGGSWLSGPANLRSAYRDRFDPSVRNFDLGFRLVQDK